MTTETTPTPITRESLEAALKEAQATFEARQVAYKAEMLKGGDADDDAVEALITARKVAKNAVSSAESALTTFASNESWQSLAATLRPVNRALEATAASGLPTPTPTGLNGSVNIADDGAVTLDIRITFADADTAELKTRIRTLVENARDAFKEKNVKGFTFKLVKGESGTWAPSIAPAGAKAAATPKSGTTAVGSGKGSNAYTAPDGTVHTAREVIAALRSTYTGKQESIDNALATGNGVRNIAVQLCNKNGWTIAKA